VFSSLQETMGKKFTTKSGRTLNPTDQHSEAFLFLFHFHCSFFFHFFFHFLLWLQSWRSPLQLSLKDPFHSVCQFQSILWMFNHWNKGETAADLCEKPWQKNPFLVLTRTLPKGSMSFWICHDKSNCSANQFCQFVGLIAWECCSLIVGTLCFVQTLSKINPFLHIWKKSVCRENDAAKRERTGLYFVWIFLLCVLLLKISFFFGFECVE